MKFRYIILIGLSLNCSYEVLGESMDHYTDPKYEPTKLATITAWEIKYGVIEDNCLDVLDQYEVVEIDRGTLTPCGENKPRVDGCHVGAWKIIYLVNDMDTPKINYTMVHEWIHAIGGCVLNDKNPKHDYSDWWSLDNPDSIVSIGVSIVDNYL